MDLLIFQDKDGKWFKVSEYLGYTCILYVASVMQRSTLAKVNGY